jgi:FAD/FMN-containing dehydrogenase
VGLVPSGGRTGLSGGATATNGEIVVSLTKMRRMDDVDPIGCTLRVQAGAVLQAVHDHCAPHGLTWPVDLAAKGSCTIGGNIATNAGGVKVIRYGLTRQWVLGLEVVLASGAVLDVGGALEKDNTGIDLRQLFVGSEGTLGIVTEATLKLTKTPGPQTVMVLGVPTITAVLSLFREVRHHSPFTISAYELFSHRCLQHVLSHRNNLRAPFASNPAYYVLIEADSCGVAEETDGWLTNVVAKGMVSDGTIALHSGEANQLWALREGIGESLEAHGDFHANDVALPIDRLDAFCADLDRLFERSYPGCEVCVFGHIGDGNLHINILKPAALASATFVDRMHEADVALFSLVKHHRGSISAEHGIGLLKKPFLSYSRSAAELDTMRGIKRVLDPNNVLNPGKIFDL